MPENGLRDEVIDQTALKGQRHIENNININNNNKSKLEVLFILDRQIAPLYLMSNEKRGPNAKEPSAILLYVGRVTTHHTYKMTLRASFEGPHMKRGGNT